MNVNKSYMHLFSEIELTSKYFSVFYSVFLLTIIYHKITLNMPVKLFFGLWILRSSIAFQNRDIFHPDWHPVGILDSQSKSGLSRQNRDDWTLCKVDFRKLKFYIQAVFLFLTLKLIINTLTNETIVERGYKHKLFQYQHLVVYHWL